MSDSAMAPADPRVLVNEPTPVAPAPRPPQVVISEHAVMLGTAAAVTVPREGSSHHLMAALAAMLHHHHRQHHAHPHYPPRMGDVLEHAAMEREMHRL
jgi:hypothetical protein